MSTTTYTREDLIAICERAPVPVKRWSNRDTAAAQEQMGRCWALLKAGCDFLVIRRGSLASTDRTVWVEITWPGFAHFDYDGGSEDDTFYLPTVARLDSADGGDWY